MHGSGGSAKANINGVLANCVRYLAQAYITVMVAETQLSLVNNPRLRRQAHTSTFLFLTYLATIALDTQGSGVSEATDNSLHGTFMEGMTVTPEHLAELH